MPLHRSIQLSSILLAKPHRFEQIVRSQRACACEYFAGAAAGSGPGGDCQSSDAIVHVCFGRWELGSIARDAREFLFKGFADVDGDLTIKTYDCGPG